MNKIPNQVDLFFILENQKVLGLARTRFWYFLPWLLLLFPQYLERWGFILWWLSSLYRLHTNSKKFKQRDYKRIQNIWQKWDRTHRHLRSIKLIEKVIACMGILKICANNNSIWPFHQLHRYVLKSKRDPLNYFLFFNTFIKIKTLNALNKLLFYNCWHC